MNDTIEVYCDDCDDQSHEGRRWVVDVLTRGDDGFWSTKRHPGRGTGSAVQFLADDDRLTGRKLPDPPDEDSPVGDRLRGRYRLRCRHCGFAVVLREENAVPVFETLAWQWTRTRRRRLSRVTRSFDPLRGRWILQRSGLTPVTRPSNQRACSTSTVSRR